MKQKKNQTKPKTNILFATSNPGKLTEASIFAKSTGVDLVSVKDIGLELDVDETGDTYEQNSLLKVMAYAERLNDPKLIIIADDGGIEIPVLGNAPGVHSRRWKGYTMTDQEIIDHCMEQLEGKKGSERDAQFISVVTVKLPGHPVKYFRESMQCHIVEHPEPTDIIEGFPFRSLMYIPEIDKMMYEIHGTSIEDRGGFRTHREKALAKAFDWIATQSNGNMV